MKTKILIDLASIKKNKDAGSMTTNVLVGKEVTFKAKRLPKEFKGLNEHEIAITQWTEENGEQVNVEGYINSDDIVRRLEAREIKGVSWTTYYKRQQIKHQAIATYDYHFVNTEVTCKHCKSKVMTNDLGEDEISDEWVSEICPKCYQIECCELEFETIEEAFKRKEDEQHQKVLIVSEKIRNKRTDG